jgi:transcriptional regulator with XRE-family HTH domain
MNTLSERLKTLRLDASLSQKSIAERLGMPQSTWGNYENQKAEPNITLLGKICSEFDVNIEWLLLGRGPMRGNGNCFHEEERLKGEKEENLMAEVKEFYSKLEGLYGKLIESHERERALMQENVDLKVNIESILLRINSIEEAMQNNDKSLELLFERIFRLSEHVEVMGLETLDKVKKLLKSKNIKSADLFSSEQRTNESKPQ